MIQIEYLCIPIYIIKHIEIFVCNRRRFALSSYFIYYQIKIHLLEAKTILTLFIKTLL